MLAARVFSFTVGLVAGAIAGTALWYGAMFVGDKAFGSDPDPRVAARSAVTTTSVPTATVPGGAPEAGAPSSGVTEPSTTLPLEAPAPPTEPSGAAPPPSGAAAPPPADGTPPAESTPPVLQTVTLVDIFDANGVMLVTLRIGDESHDLELGDDAVSPDGSTVFFLDAIEGGCARIYDDDEPFRLCRGQSITR